MKKILLIEDNPNILENLTEYLELEGFKIITAENGKKGVEIAASSQPDLIICDFYMPELNGREVFIKILDNPLTHHIPFIFSTSMSEKVDREAAMALGADEYIVKPFELESLLKVINHVLQVGCKRRVQA